MYVCYDVFNTLGRSKRTQPKQNLLGKGLGRSQDCKYGESRNSRWELAYLCMIFKCLVLKVFKMEIKCKYIGFAQKTLPLVSLTHHTIYGKVFGLF